MARNPQEFLDKSLKKYLWARYPRPERVWNINGPLSSVSLNIPFFGIAKDYQFGRQEGMEDSLNQYTQLEFYLVDQSGNEFHCDSDAEHLEPIFAKIAELSIQPRNIDEQGDIEGDTHGKPTANHYDRFDWKLQYMSEPDLRRLCSEMGLIVVADQWRSHFGRDAWLAIRTVFPDSLRVKKIPQMLDGASSVAFVKFNKNGAEYRMEDGTSVFDQRSIDHDVRTASDTKIWKFALRRYVSQFEPKGKDGVPPNKAEKLVWLILQNLSGADDGYGICAQERMNLVDSALAVLTGSPYFPLAIFLKEALYEFEVRKVYRDGLWEREELQSGNVLNPTYVIVRDTEEGKSKVSKDRDPKTSGTFRLGDMRRVQ